MAVKVRLLQHEESVEVRYSDERPSVYYYFDSENPLRRVLMNRFTKDDAIKLAQDFARSETIRLSGG